MGVVLAIVCISLTVCLRLWRLADAPAYNGDEGEYAIMVHALLRGEWPTNFISPNHRPLVGPVLWLGNGVWACFTHLFAGDVASWPTPTWWLRLPNVCVSGVAVGLFWWWRSTFVRDWRLAWCGALLLATAVSEVLGARIAWDPGAYGFVAVAAVIAARTSSWKTLVMLSVVALMTHPLLTLLAPWVWAHVLSAVPERWQRRGWWIMIAAMLLSAALLVRTCLLGTTAIGAFAFDAAAVLPGAIHILSGGVQWQDVSSANAMHEVELLWLGLVMVVLLLGRSRVQVGWLCSFVWCVAVAGMIPDYWRYSSLLSIPLLLEMIFSAQRILDVQPHARMPVVVCTLVFVLQTAALTSAIAAAKPDLVWADVEAVLHTKPSSIYADDWSAQRPFVLVLHGTPSLPVVRRRRHTRIMDERIEPTTAVVVRADVPRNQEVIEALHAQGRRLIPFRSSGLTYVAALPLNGPVVEPE
jgi:hypothetical protein